MNFFGLRFNPDFIPHSRNFSHHLQPYRRFITTCVKADRTLERDQLLHIFWPTPALNVKAIDREILEEAALIRATTKLKLPDAIHLATALRQQCDSFLTNDGMFHTLNLPQIKILSDLNLL